MIPTQRESSSQILHRAVQVLSAFSDGDGSLTVGQIAARTGIPQSTAYRLVGELVELGLLERDGRSLRMGMRVFEFGQLASRRRSLREVALPFIADLREATHQTIHFAALDGIEVVYLEILPAHNGPPLPSRVGGRLPAHATGVGKAMLAFSDADRLDEVLATGLPRMAPGTICEPGTLRKQLAKIATTTVAFDHEESGPQIVCAASPILTGDGRPLAAISVSGWSGRVDLRRVAPAVMTCAKAISRVAAARGVTYV